MPWCDDCSKFWNLPQLADGHSCPTCGAALVGPVPAAVPAVKAAGAGLAGQGEEDGPPGAEEPVAGAAKLKGAPWHFKLLVVGVTGYMIYRVIWFIEWLPKHV